MAIIKTGESISKIAGSVGDHVYSSWKGRGVIRQKAANRANPNSPRQAAARAGVTALSKFWTGVLNPAQRAMWGELVQAEKVPVDPASSREQGSRVVIPRPKNVLSGYDAFIRHNQRAILAGARPLSNPARTPGLIKPGGVTSLRETVIPPFTPNFALDFDGVNEDVILGDVLGYEYTSPVSWEFWLNMDTLIDGERIVTKFHAPTLTGYSIFWSGGALVFLLYRHGVGQWLEVKRVFPTIGAWKHIVITYDGSNNANGMFIYVDTVIGQVIVRNLPMLGSILTDADLIFGSRDALPSTFLDGKLDCIRNYNRVITQPQVNILFAGGAGFFSPDPFGDGSCQGAWMFCTGGGMNLWDLSGNGYTGVLRNMEEGDWIIGHVPCPAIPGGTFVGWTEPVGLPAGAKVRIWIFSEDAGVHRQHIGTVDAGIGLFTFDSVRIAQGRTVPLANMPGHYLIQADIVTGEGQISPPSNVLEWTVG